MGKIVPLHHSDSLALPLSDGAVLRVTAFHGSPRVALTIHGPAGGDGGGVVLHADRARLLASWLLRMADSAGPEVLPGPVRRSTPADVSG